ncbi:type II toxin-antitoxin system RelE/ParE family toxin [Aerosakkonemataceae cyanobacterium BLCC-F154]|uniref:Type II toxin-antitoxin system RelE/ParE family toxin n=1 Tax=Floridaenema fluviatile BLCC-F154 TaxID=3153640 RepID=A0ABV4YE33_9CYAN
MQDLRDIVAFKEQYSSKAALNIVEKITQKFQTLAKFPSIGKPRSDLVTGIRSFPVEDYLIFYFPTEAGIEIARVVSGYRDLEALFVEVDDS